jgi:sec-independent protein translocase protein TatC
MKGSAEMPFLDHLEELRWRIIYSLAALVVGVGAAFVVVLRFDLLTWLQGPVLPYLHGRRLMTTAPGEAFSVLMQSAIMVGIVLASPILIYQVWAFLSPALHRHEKRMAVPVIVGVVALFIAGAALAWYFVLPLTLRFLSGIGEANFDQMYTVSAYFNFVSSMVLALGAVFELPIAVLLLSVLGFVTPQMLSRFRKHAAIGSYLVAALITPGDAFVGSVALMGPLYLLYELSIGLSYIVSVKKRRKAEAEALAEAEGASA